MLNIAGKRDGIAGLEDHSPAGNHNRDRTFADLQQFLGAGRVGFTLVVVSGSQGPVPEFNHIR